MLIEIQSVSDIITNSSSEVFLTDSKPTIEFLDKAGIYYRKFDTEEDIKNYIFSESYYLYRLDDVLDYNPLSDDWAIEALLKRRTKEEIWEFYKPWYMELLGKVFVNVDRDYYYSKLEKIGR